MPRNIFFALCLAIVTSACDTPTTAARFSDATPEQIERALHIASAEEAGLWAYVASLFAGRSDPMGCPAVQTSGATTVADGSCDSGRNAGTLTAWNVRSSPVGTNPGYDRSLPSHALFQQYAGKDVLIEGGVVVETFTHVIDGTVDWHPTAGTIDIVLGVSEYDVHSFADLHFRCGAARMCSASESTIWVEGLGSAEVTGSWAFDAPWSGTLSLRGEDTIAFNMAMDGSSRVTYSITRDPPKYVTTGTNKQVFLHTYE